MIYIYDIVLNFQSKFYKFYEWSTQDHYLNIKKIPIFRIPTSELLSLYQNVVQLKKELLEKIERQTTIYMQNNLHYKYLLLVSNTENTIALSCDDNGIVTNVSSLLFDEEDEANELAENLEEESIVDTLVSQRQKNEFISRLKEEKIQKIKKMIQNLDVNLDKEKIRYLYFDVFEKELDTIEKMKTALLRISQDEQLDRINEILSFVNKTTKS